MIGFRLLGPLGHLAGSSRGSVVCMSVWLCVSNHAELAQKLPGKGGCGGRGLEGYAEMVPDCRVCFEFLLYEPVLALRHGNNL